MSDPHVAETLDLNDRLALIERMIGEGQRTVERGGWVLLLWGAGHALAIGWSYLIPEHPGLPWAVLMPACGIAQGIVEFRHRGTRTKRTVVHRLVTAVWAAILVSILILWLGAMLAHGFRNLGAFLGAVFILIGAANFSGGTVLRFRAQVLAAIGWWAGALALFFVPEVLVFPVFLAVALLCEVAFGLYLIRRERQVFANA